MKDNRSIEEKLFYSPDLEMTELMKMDELLSEAQSYADKKNYEEELNKKTEMIPVELIDNREVNDYSISDIEELKESIKNHGLQQSIVVKRKGDRYVLIAGERRLTAYKALMSEARAKGDNRYDLISAIVYDENLSGQKEDAIYKETNDTQRNSTLFERIYRLNPKEHYFKDGNRLNSLLAKDYLELKSAKDKKFIFETDIDSIVQAEVTKSEKTYLKKPDYVSRLENINNDLISIKWDTDQTMVDYITLKLANRYKDVNISNDGVRKYTYSIMECSYKPLITELVFKGIITPKTLREITDTVKDVEGQIDVYNKILKGEKWKEDKKEEQAVKELTPEEKMKDLVNELKLFVKHFENSGIDICKFSGEDKKKLTKIRNIKAIIETIKKDWYEILDLGPKNEVSIDKPPKIAINRGFSLNMRGLIGQNFCKIWNFIKK